MRYQVLLFWLLSFVCCFQKLFCVASLQESIAGLQASLEQSTASTLLEFSLEPFIPLCTFIDQQTTTYIQQKKYPLLPTQLASAVSAIERVRAQSIAGVVMEPLNSSLRRDMSRLFLQNLFRTLQALQIKLSLPNQVPTIISSISFFQALRDFFVAADEECELLNIATLTYQGAVEECEKLLINCALIQEMPKAGFYDSRSSFVQMVFEKVLNWVPYLTIAGTIGGGVIYLKRYLEGPLQQEIAHKLNQREQDIRQFEQLVTLKTEEARDEIRKAHEKVQETHQLLQLMQKGFAGIEGKTNAIGEKVHEVEQGLNSVCSNLNKAIKETFPVKSSWLSKKKEKSPMTSPSFGRKEQKGEEESEKGEEKKKKKKKERRESTISSLTVPQSFNSILGSGGVEVPKIVISDSERSPQSSPTYKKRDFLRPFRTKSVPLDLQKQKTKKEEDSSEE